MLKTNLEIKQEKEDMMDWLLVEFYTKGIFSENIWLIGMTDYKKIQDKGKEFYLNVKDGIIFAVWEAVNRWFMKSSYCWSAKKIYKLTEEGVKRVEEILAQNNINL